MPKRQVKNLQIHDLIALNRLEHSTLWRVIKIDGFHVGIIDASIEDTHPNQQPQCVDISQVMRPTKAQLARHNC